MRSENADLFADIDSLKARVDNDFLDWFNNNWSQRNSLSCLSAPLEKIKLGALIEWEYINRGAIEDRRKYCDVILPQFSGATDLIVDTKYVGIKKSRAALFDRVLDRYRGRRDWYRSLNIEEIHSWSHLDGSSTIEPWFRWVVKTGEVIEL